MLIFNGNKNYDRATLFYLMDNVTTLSLAYYFTNEKKFAARGVALVSRFFLENDFLMYPSLKYAQGGDHSGLFDFKDVYYLLDASKFFDLKS